MIAIATAMASVAKVSLAQSTSSSDLVQIGVTGSSVDVSFFSET